MFLNKDTDFTNRRLAALKNDIQAAASDISINALCDISDFAKNSYSETSEELKTNVNNFMQSIIDTRPSIKPLTFGLKMLEKRVDKLGSLSLLALRETYELQAKDIENLFLQKRNLTAQNANKQIKNGMNLLIHGYSQTLLQTIKLAHKDGKKINCILSEARPSLQGNKMAKELSDYVTNITFVHDVQWSNVIMQADKVFLSAEAILADGSFIGKVGSKTLALLGKDNAIGVYVVADTFKHTQINPNQIKLEKMQENNLEAPRAIKNINFQNYIYDITPSRLIKTWIDERGAKDRFSSAYKTNLKLLNP